jgi:hypothetical protein
MADTLKATVTARVTSLFSNELTTDGVGITSKNSAELNLEPVLSFTDGTGAAQADKIIKIPGQTLSSTTTDIDVYDLGSLDLGLGAGRDNLGQTVALAEVAALLIYVHSGSTGTLLVGGNGTTAAWNSAFNGDDDAKIGPFPAKSIVMLATSDAAGFAVADTSNHLLRLEAVSGVVNYDIVIIGRTA